MSKNAAVKTKGLYYAETMMGACVRKAESESAARSKILREVGTYNGIQKLRPATEEDISWVTAMGGVIY